MVSLFFVESAGKEVHFLNSLFNRLDEMALRDSWNFWFFVVKEGSDNPFNVSRGSLRILKEAFQIEDRSFGIGEEITGDQDLIDHLSFRIDGDRDSDQSSWGFPDGS